MCSSDLVMLALAGVGVAKMRQPPPPWDFSGHVIDSETRLPIAGVEVDVERHQYMTYTDAEGRYVFHLPQPRLQYVHLEFAKQGYRGEEPVSVSADRPFDTDMTKIDGPLR